MYGYYLSESARDFLTREASAHPSVPGEVVSKIEDILNHPGRRYIPLRPFKKGKKKKKRGPVLFRKYAFKNKIRIIFTLSKKGVEVVDIDYRPRVYVKRRR